MLRMIDMPQLDLGSYNELYDILIPGDNEVTISAVSSLVENVQSGEPVYESLVTFCDEIIVNAA